MWLETCLRDRDLPVIILMYRAISSLRPFQETKHKKAQKGQVDGSAARLSTVLPLIPSDK